MITVIDANPIISALIKPGVSREIIINREFKFVTPSYTLTEIYKHKNEICKKAKISQKEFDDLLYRLFGYIRIINSNHYSEKLKEAKILIEDIDDVTYIACALYLNCPIWSDDKHFKKQNKIKILTTKEILKYLN